MPADTGAAGEDDFGKKHGACIRKISIISFSVSQIITMHNLTIENARFSVNRYFY